MPIPRLRQLRLARGLTLDGLAAAMGGLVTKQALHKYESGEATPSPVVLNKLAATLKVKAVHLWSEPAIRVEFVAYRKRSSLPKGEAERVESFVIEALEDRVRLQELTNQVPSKDLRIRSLVVNSLDDADGAAAKVRERWRLGLDPIASVSGTLEDHHVHVIEIDANEKFDGISAVAYDGENREQAAAVVTRSGVPGERQRLNMTHEFAHLVMKLGEGVDEEKAAFRFGAAFLAPAEVLFREVGQKRHSIEIQELLLLKRRFGMSLQALIYRLRTLDIISDAHLKQWFITINKMGWRKQEPGPVPAEEPQWLKQAVLRVLSEKQISVDEASRILGKCVPDQLPLTLVERRSFMDLPPERRRLILSEHAARLEQYYKEAEVRGEFEVADFVEGGIPEDGTATTAD